MTKTKPLRIEVLTQKRINRFWGRVNKTNTCWLWTGRKIKGYGMIDFARVQFVATRLAFYFRHKTDPHPFHVLHTCDNPTCVNPSHLFLGTQTDNNNDMYQKGRSKKAKGSDNGNSKLFEEEVKAIKQLLKENYIQRTIAIQFGISLATIEAIKAGKIWKHIV